MNIVMDEKLKHRLIGLAVIISLGAIFAPAMMKKSNQRAENFSVNVTLPPKPSTPNVVMSDEKEVFKTIKVAKVTLPSVPEGRQLPEFVKAERIKSDLLEKPKALAQTESHPKAQPVRIALNEQAKPKAKKIIKVASVAPVKRNPALALRKQNTHKVVRVAKTPSRTLIKPGITADVYALQLASFTQLTNAQILVSKLRNRGYKANYTTARSGQGAVYKVLVGHSPRRNDVLRLKGQLASAMQLNGFIVNTRVS